MPRINIYEKDNSGVNVTAETNAVVVIGDVPVKDKVQMDINNCILIQPTDALADIFDTTTLTQAQDTKVRTLMMIDALLYWRLPVLYHKEAEFATIDNAESIDLSFLNDKDEYDFKFLTSGVISNIKFAQGVEDTQLALNLYQKLLTIADTRHDCVVLATPVIDSSLADRYSSTTGNVFVKDFKTKLEAETFDGTNSTMFLTDGVCQIPDRLNLKQKYDANKRDIHMPAWMAYLNRYSEAVTYNQKWQSIAGVDRGVVDSVFSPDMPVMKSVVDNNIITDNGISFNIICNVRPYGKVIWGDRTLRKNTGKIKATSYLSIRLLICDISKRVYQSAINQTYQSNNDITWMNFKSIIADLLDQAVEAGVLSGYDIKKVNEANTPGNKLVAKISISANLPVEDFDIYIDVQNADVTYGQE